MGLGLSKALLFLNLDQFSRERCGLNFQQLWNGSTWFFLFSALGSEDYRWEGEGEITEPKVREDRQPESHPHSWFLGVSLNHLPTFKTWISQEMLDFQLHKISSSALQGGVTPEVPLGFPRGSVGLS